MSPLAIETHGLTKRFGKQTAVAGIDLAVPVGSVFGFLGPNGSGKTTTIRMLLGLVEASAGSLSVLGESMPARSRTVLPRVGALVEGPAFYPYLSGWANLHRFDTADPTAQRSDRADRVQAALHRVGLEGAARKKVGAYSLGMKQRLGIANALLQPRELLVLDEPTNGLDPQGTREVRSLIRSLSADGTTIFVSSHLLAEVEQLCSHVAIMSAGSVVAQGALDELQGAGDTHVRLRTPDADRAVAVLLEHGLTPTTAPMAESGGEELEFWVAAPLATAQAASVAREPELLLVALVTAQVRVRAYAVEAPSLEERFVALTGEGFDVLQ